MDQTLLSLKNNKSWLDSALDPVIPIRSPGRDYEESSRKWQGVPGIEIASNGRLWAAWYTGGRTEDENNHVVVVTSMDGGVSWSEPVLAIDPPGEVRASDPVLWHDPLGRLWLFWMQSAHCGTTFDGRAGVWAITTGRSGEADPEWSAPRRVANGIMMNKPTVLSTGEWLLPCAVWSHHKEPTRFWLPNEAFSNVIVSRDQGETFRLLGSADVPNRQCDEHIIVERNDGSVWMAVRCNDGIRRAVSRDRGKTWEAEQKIYFPGPCARFHLRKLSSGRLFLLYHDHPSDRTNLTAFLSEDEGDTWPYRLLLDERDLVSYPDAVEAPGGEILVIYDRRRTGEGEILFQTLTEADIIKNRGSGYDGRKTGCISRLHRRTLGHEILDFSDKSLIDRIRKLSIVLDESENSARWTSLRAWEAEGEMALPPFFLPEGNLRLIGKIGSDGFIKVELENCWGKPIEGYRREESVCRTDSGSAICVEWKQRSGLESLTGQLIRICFILKNATLEGIQFCLPAESGGTYRDSLPSTAGATQPALVRS